MSAFSGPAIFDNNNNNNNDKDNDNDNNNNNNNNTLFALPFYLLQEKNIYYISFLVGMFKF